VPCIDLSFCSAFFWRKAVELLRLLKGKDRNKCQKRYRVWEVQGENYGRPSLKGDTGNERHTTIQGPALALKCGHPFFTRLSAVRHLLCIRGHACNLHLGIPFVFQICCAEGTNKLR
jgi:hypothetical protein